MTTREAIAIVREQAAEERGVTREAMLLVAAACEHHHARRTIRKKARRLSNCALYFIREHLMLTPPESGCERDYGTHRVTGGGTPDKGEQDAAAHGGPSGTLPRA